MDAILAAIKLASLFGTAGVFFALGFAGVCRWLEWAPVNTTVIIKNFYHGNDDVAPSSGSEG